MHVVLVATADTNHSDRNGKSYGHNLLILGWSVRFVHQFEDDKMFTFFA